MKQYTYSKRKRLMLFIASFCTLGYSLANLLVLFRIYNETVPIVIYFRIVMIFSACLFASSYFIKSNFSQIEISDKGLTRYVFKQKRLSINYNDIKEVTVGYVDTPLGKRKRLAFCSKVLDEHEVNNLAFVDDSCIYFSRISKECYQEIIKYYQIPIDISDWIKD